MSPPIKKPTLDDRDYRCVTLPNQMVVLLVHDAMADKASAAMDVLVGSFQDPDDVPGLAHFLEHLLFLGTAKYPRENDYSEFLSQHGGHSNAYTSSTHTNYYFDVAHEHLEPALDRLAQFFIAPLFKRDGVERELNAVDSEFKKNLQSDSRRTYQILKSSCDPAHPFNRFDTGNWETLRDTPRQKEFDVLERLFAFHRRYYSANRMRLVVLGRESLDQLEQMVVDKFSSVENKNVDVPIPPGHPLTLQHGLQKFCCVKPVKDFRRLVLYFSLPDQSMHWRTKPLHYASHLIGHESAGSILSVLKQRGWALSLYSGASDYAKGFEIFTVGVELTVEGLKNYKEIVRLVFQYIKMIRESPVQEWIFRECAKVSDISFRFKEKTGVSSFTSGTASRLHDYPPEDVLSGPYSLEHYDPVVISDMLKRLVPHNTLYALAAQDFSTVDIDIPAWQKERWYGAEFAMFPASAEWLEQLAAAPLCPELFRFPSPNEFLPDSGSLDVTRTRLEAVEPPTLLCDEEMLRVWHKQDCKFLVPKENSFFIIKSPSNQSPYHAVVMKLYVELVKEALTEYSYMAECAGLSYSLDVGVDGVVMSFGGLADKLHLLIKSVVTRMRNLHISASDFAVQKESLEQNYRNWAKEAPNQHAMYYTTYCVKDLMWTPDEKLQALTNSVTGPHDIYAFMNEFYRMFHVEAFIHGNCDSGEALKVSEMVVEVLGKPTQEAVSYAQSGIVDAVPPISIPLPAQLRNTARGHTLPPGTCLAVIRHCPDPQNPNSAIEYFMQTGNVAESRTRAHTYVLAQMLHEAAFNQLRTKEQLGYIVWASIRKNIGLMGIRIVIQSERDTIYLENRIDSFLREFRKMAEMAPPEDLEKYKLSVINQLAQRDDNLGQESSRWWHSIQDGYYEFNRVQSDVGNIRSLNKADLLQFYDRFIMPTSASRQKLSLHIRSQKEFPTPAPSSLGAPLTNLSLLQAALRDYHGIHLDDDELTALVGGELSAPGTASVTVSSSSTDSLTEASKTVESVAAESDDIIIDWKALADRVAARLQIQPQLANIQRASSVTETDDQPQLQPATASPLTKKKSLQFGSFAFATHTQIIHGDDAWLHKSQFPLTDLARPLVPAFMQVTGSQ